MNTAVCLAAAVDTLLALPQAPEAVVLTGDLVDLGAPAEYEHLQLLLAPLSQPCFLLPGNHDSRVQLRRSFLSHAYLANQAGDEFVQYTAQLGSQGLRLVALDTVEPGHEHGRLCGQRLRWLADVLDCHRGAPVLLAMHHPPFETAMGGMDRIGLLEGAPALAEILSDHPAVERVVCGHLHRSIFAHCGGVAASTAPSPAYQMHLDLAPRDEPAWTLEPPGFHLHAWLGPGRLVTHVVPVGSFGGGRAFG
jgi:3',5'-cyclic AMP phosphodiesterase CpdA